MGNCISSSSGASKQALDKTRQIDRALKLVRSTFLDMPQVPSDQVALTLQLFAWVDRARGRRPGRSMYCSLELESQVRPSLLMRSQGSS